MMMMILLCTSGSAVSVFPITWRKVINVFSLSRVIVPNVTENAKLSKDFSWNIQKFVQIKIDWNLFDAVIREILKKKKGDHKLRI